MSYSQRRLPSYFNPLLGAAELSPASSRRDRNRKLPAPELDWTVFQNPSLYSFCSPGFLIIVSLLFEIAALVIASYVWCFDSQFKDMALEFGLQNETEKSREQMIKGCLDPINEGFEGMEKGIELSVSLAGHIGMDPLSRGAAETKRKNYENFKKDATGRQGFFRGWFHHVIATIISIILGVAFFVLQLLVVAKRLWKYFSSLGILRNLTTLSGIIHYCVGYVGLKSIDALQLDYLFKDSALFLVGVSLSSSAWIADVWGSVLTAKHCKKEMQEDPALSGAIEQRKPVCQLNNAVNENYVMAAAKPDSSPNGVPKTSQPITMGLYKHVHLYKPPGKQNIDGYSVPGREVGKAGGGPEKRGRRCGQRCAQRNRE